MLGVFDGNILFKNGLIVFGGVGLGGMSVKVIRLEKNRKIRRYCYWSIVEFFGELFGVFWVC